MSRKPRVAFPGAVYHVMCRGVDGREVFTDDRDRVKRIKLLEKTIINNDIHLFAYVLMNNHDHYFFRTPEPNISRAMHYFNSCYCTWFNKRHQRRGVLFQSRFTAHLVEEIGYFLELSRYIHLNPVRAGLVDRPEDYSWSSYRGYHDEVNRVPWIQYQAVLEEFGMREEMATSEYRKFMNHGVDSPPKAPWKEAIDEIAIGSIEFAEKVSRRLKEEKKRTSATLKLLQRPSLQEIASRVSEITRLKIPTWRINARDNSLLRPLLAYAAKRLYGYQNAEVARWLGLKDSSSITRAVKKAENHIDSLEQIVEKIMQ